MTSFYTITAFLLEKLAQITVSTSKSVRVRMQSLSINTKNYQVIPGNLTSKYICIFVIYQELKNSMIRYRHYHGVDNGMPQLPQT